MNASRTTPIKNKMGGVFIHVTNLKKSVEWYSNLLGFEVDIAAVESPVFNIPVSGDTGLTLDDHTFDPHFERATTPNPIFNFIVNDIDEAYQFITNQGIKVTREIERIGDDFAWFNFADPDGNVLMACTC